MPGWSQSIAQAQSLLERLLAVQAAWCELEPLFGSHASSLQEDPGAAAGGGGIASLRQCFRRATDLWRRCINQLRQVDTRVALCVKADEVPILLQQMRGALDGAQSGLHRELQRQRRVFPRFFFFSDSEMLSILGAAQVPLTHSAPCTQRHALSVR